MEHLFNAGIKLNGRWFVAVSRSLSIVFLIVILVMAADRQHPYKLLSVAPAEVHACGQLEFISRVWRDTSRDCSAQVHRELVDNRGFRFTVPAPVATDETIDQAEHEYPGLGMAVVELPCWWRPGASAMVSSIFYRCNPTHVFAPIQVTVVRPFTALPKQ